MNVGLLQVVAKILHGLGHHSGESLVDLQEIQVIHGPASLLQCRIHSLGWLGEKRGIWASGLSVLAKGREDVQAVVLGVLAGREHHGSSTVGDLRGGCSGDRAVLHEGRPQLAQALGSRSWANALVLGDRDGLLALLDLDGQDLLGKRTILGRCLGALVRLCGDLVLLLTGQARLRSVAIGLEAHGGAGNWVSQAIALQGISEVQGTKALTGAHTSGNVRSVGHRFLTSGNHDVCVAHTKQTGRIDHRIETGKADLVDRQRGNVNGNTRLHGSLLGWILTGTGLHDLPHQHVIHVIGRHTGLVQGALNHVCTEVHGGQGGQRTEHTALWRTDGSDNNDILRVGLSHDSLPLSWSINSVATNSAFLIYISTCVARLGEIRSSLGLL